MPIRYDDPATWTIDYVHSVGYQLWIYCTGPCRENRMVDLLAVAAAGKGRRRIKALTFRCQKCRRIGEPVVSWWERGRADWNYANGHTKGELPSTPPRVIHEIGPQGTTA
jgi:hypothetical protein